MDLSEVKDEVFSKRMMGDGYAVLPETNDVYSPVTGQVMTIFPTKHAIGIRTSYGVEVLIHIGIDTVDLEGLPFKLYIKEGQIVDQQTKLLTVDLAFLEQKGKNSAVIVLLTNSDMLKKIRLTNVEQVTAGSEIGSAELK